MKNNNFAELNGNSEFKLTKRLRVWADIEWSKGSEGKINYAKGIRIHHQINRKRLEESIQKVIDDNDALRAIFYQRDDQFYMKVAKNYKFNLIEIDALGDDRDQKLAYIKMDAQTRIDSDYDLSKPSADFVFYKIYTDDYVLFINMSHLITDGVSFGLTFFNIISYYMEGKPAFSSEGTYLDYIEEERMFLDSSRCLEQKKYWDEVMDGYDPILVSSLKPIGDASYCKEKSGTYFSLKKNKIDQVALNNNTSVFNIILLAFHLTIAALHNKLDNTILFADANRNESKYKATLGFLSFFIPNRITIKRNSKLSDLLNIVSESAKMNYLYKKTSSLYADSPFIFSFINENMVMTPGVNLDSIEIIDFLNGRDSPLAILVCNELKDYMMFDLTCSSRYYGQNYIEEFTQIFSNIIEVIETNEDIQINKLLTEDDIVEI